MKRFRQTSVLLSLTALMGAMAACARPDPQETPSMKPSVTYLHLLRHTPFFTELTTDQLRWVIGHSREWEVTTGQPIVTPESPNDFNGYWILLDGGWDLIVGGQRYPSGHADPGKWFNRDRVSNHDYRLTANDHSYVMHIAAADMDDMLARGFRLDRHLAAGKQFYSGLNATNGLPAAQ